MTNISCLLDRKSTIKEAMNAIEKINPKIVFVVDGMKLIGSLTDGDIRRYLAKNGKVDDLCDKACNLQPIVAKTINEAKNKYNNELVAIPILSDNKIIDVYFGNNNVIKNKINIPVVINAGGKGSRLEPFTKVLPKPLIPIGDLPIMEHIMKRFELFGCTNFSSIINYKKQLIKAYFKECEYNYNLVFVDENEPLGTAGGLSLLKNKINETFFFVNCDTLLMSDYSEILKFHKNNKNDITMVCAQKRVSVPFGVVNINNDFVIDEIIEKPSYSFLTNVGFYVIEPIIIQNIQENKKIDMPELIKYQQNKGSKIAVYQANEEDWLDMGQFDELDRMRKIMYEE